MHPYNTTLYTCFFQTHGDFFFLQRGIWTSMKGKIAKNHSIHTHTTNGLISARAEGKPGRWSFPSSEAFWLICILISELKAPTERQPRVPFKQVDLIKGWTSGAWSCCLCTISPTKDNEITHRSKTLQNRTLESHQLIGEFSSLLPSAPFYIALKMPGELQSYSNYCYGEQGIKWTVIAFKRAGISLPFKSRAQKSVCKWININANIIYTRKSCFSLS